GQPCINLLLFLRCVLGAVDASIHESRPEEPPTSTAIGWFVVDPWICRPRSIPSASRTTLPLPELWGHEPGFMEGWVTYTANLCPIDCGVAAGQLGLRTTIMHNESGHGRVFGTT